MNIALNLILLYLGVIASTWLHELGHYIFARISGFRPPLVVFGTGPIFAAVYFQSARIDWCIGLNPTTHQFFPKSRLAKRFVQFMANFLGDLFQFRRNPFGGMVVRTIGVNLKDGTIKALNGGENWRQSIFSTLGGPVTNLFLGILGVILVHETNGRFLHVIALLAVFNFFVASTNGIPGHYSDGTAVMLDFLGKDRTQELIAKYQKYFRFGKVVTFFGTFVATAYILFYFAP